jgi:molecular chaperone DnaK (HSP70)
LGLRVGIDLGTTFCAVARIDVHSGKPEVINNSYGKSITPSVLCFEANGNILFGEDAKSMQEAGDKNVASFFKRSMGNDAYTLEIHGKTYSPTDLSAILLRNLKNEAEQQTGEKIDAAVITVPAYFSHKERSATIEAGRKAGLEVIAIINEPTAAIFAYGLTDSGKTQTVLIYDLGGGTFDVTIARVTKDNIEVLGSDGNHGLGGKDWDDCITRFLVGEFEEQYGADISEDDSMMESLMVMSETAKKQLTSRDAINIPISYKGIHGTIELTNEMFENISSHLIGTTKDVTERLLSSLKLKWSNIDGVILVGGSTRMRMIHNYVTEMSGKPPLGGVNVDEAVALGAAIRANITEHGETLLTIGGRAVPPPTIGARKDRTGTPDTLKHSEPMLTIRGAKAYTDVTAHSLGMIAASEDNERYINAIIIPKNTKIPSGEARPFEFNTKAGSETEVYVLQGEFDRPSDNTILHKYVITNIQKTTPPASRLNITYTYTENGVVEVSAVQQETGKDLPIRIEDVPADMSWAEGSPKDHAGRTPDVEMILAIDLSGSMSGKPLDNAKKAMADFVKQMDPGHVKIGLVGFANKSKCILEPTDNFDTVINAINMIELGGYYGYGNTAEPFSISKTSLRNGDVRYLIVLTDGIWVHQKKAISASKECQQDGIEVMALGFGSADEKFLKAIASVDAIADFTNDLGSSFSKIARAIG